MLICTCPDWESCPALGSDVACFPWCDHLCEGAAPVVRCSECVSHGYDEEHGRHWCNSPMGCMGCVPVKPDDFCSRGKRRSEP